MAITFEKTPLEWQNPGTEPSTALKANGFSAGYKPAASTFNYQISNTSECLTELQTKLSDLDGDAIKGIKGNGTTINPSSTGIINITPNNIGAATSTHYHNASQITSGVLPIERGGTGATTAEEAKENLGIENGSGGTVLYSNSSGTTGTITLSEEYTNYNYIEIFYERKSSIGTSKSMESVRSDTTKLPRVAIQYVYNECYYLKSVQSDITLGGTSISRSTEWYSTLTSGTASGTPKQDGDTGTTSIKIYTVVGYK